MTKLYESESESSESSHQNHDLSTSSQASVPPDGEEGGFGQKWKWLSSSKSFHSGIVSPLSPTKFPHERPQSDKLQPPLLRTFGPKPQPSSTTDENKNLEQKQVQKQLDKATQQRFLAHLEHLIPKYCELLAHPTYQNASEAMALLLKSLPPLPVVVSPTPTSSLWSPITPHSSPDKNRINLARKLRERRVQLEEDEVDTEGSPTTPGKISSKNTVAQSEHQNDKKRSNIGSIIGSPFSSRYINRRKDSKSNDQPKGIRKWTSTGAYHPFTPSIMIKSLSLLSEPNSQNKYSRTNSAQSRASNPTVPNSKISQRTVNAKADEKAWEEFINPLILLAGAEAIFADLEQVHATPSVIHWSGLYQRVLHALSSLVLLEDHSELQQKQFGPLKEDQSMPSPQTPPPSFPSTRDDSPTVSSKVDSPISLPADGPLLPVLTPPRSTSFLPNTELNNDNAKSHFVALRSLCEWLKFKCQWIPLRENIFQTWSEENLLFVQAFASSFVVEAQHPSNGDCARPLLGALQEEILATQSIMEMALLLEQGR